VEDGLAELRSIGCQAVIVLGHPGHASGSRPPSPRS
jgi:hypothetical protein